MRTLITTAIISIFLQRTYGQITLDYANDTLYFGGSFHVIDISDNESKYVHDNDNTNSFSLYNMDMTLFMEVTIPFTDSLKNGFQAIYITRTLFDCDSTNIEYVYQSPILWPRTFRILRTDGTVLLEVDSARGPYGYGSSTGGSMILSPIKNTSDGAKLFLDILNPWGGGIEIYSLCDELPTSYLDFSPENSFVKVYPNPSEMMINFEAEISMVQTRACSYLF